MLDINKIYTSKNYGDFKVKEYFNSLSVRIKFVATGYEVVTRAKDIRVGNVKDKLKPSVCGVGFVGSGKYKPSIKCKETKVYIAWKGILSRCYGKYAATKYPTYKNCSMSEKWHNFQKFAEWYKQNYIDGYHLDKDILQRGVKYKVYSEDTCVFLSPKENITEARSLTRKLERAIRTLQFIADNPEWNDHHCRAKKCIDDIAL